ncbi:LamG-like jellyroll fold domain-containing protein, partial [Kibdelosporangium lantanae]
AGGKLTLWVDGVQAASGPDVAGSVSETVSFQLVLGQRLDNQFRWNGQFDDVRLYERALTTTELTKIRTTNAQITTGEVLHLPMDAVTPEPRPGWAARRTAVGTPG